MKEPIQLIIILLSCILAVYSIIDMAGRHGGIYASAKTLLYSIRHGEMKGWQFILIGLLIPQLMQLGYYVAYILNPEFRLDVEMRQDIVRSYTLFTNLILAIYFLNGRLVWLFIRMAELWNHWKKLFRTYLG